MNSILTLAEVQSAIKAGTLSTRSLVEHYIARQSAHSHLNAFIEVYEAEAREAADQIDRKFAEGTAGALAGLVLGIKDVICHQGHQLTASSRMLEGFDSLFTATALQRLLDADAIVIGRQGCDEFAMGSSNETSVYGPARNPINPEKVPGGSSGASAAAVSAGLCHASLGSDTGGSVRQPAAFCGVVGLKPTYGRIPRWGLIAYASSFDQIGPITHSVEDAARLLQVMAGADGRDNTASSQDVPDYLEALDALAGKKYTIGYLKEAMESPGLDPEVKSRKVKMIEELRNRGHQVKEVTFPLLSYVVPCYYILTTAEASSNLSRFDGIRYGFRANDAANLEEVYTHSRSQGFGQEVKRRILLGTFVLSAGYYDAYYTQAMKVRRLIRDQTRELLEECDFLLSPTTPTPAFGIGENIEDPIAMFLGDIFTVHANLAGLPAISIPWGEDKKGMPVGMQFMGKAFSEEKLLAFCHELTTLPSS